MNKIKISPSILGADFSKLGKEIKALDKAGADYIHIDVMDGNFVPNISFGPVVIGSVRKCTKKPFDVHLMIENVENYVDSFIKAGADMITFHIENTPNATKIIKHLKSKNIKVGLAVSPDTPVSKIKKYIKDIDLILIMSVYPGFGGQKYIPSEKKVREAKKMIGKLPIEISVDGGVTNKNSAGLIKAGADVLISGSYITKSNSYRKAIKSLR